jgi:PKD repeat protein
MSAVILAITALASGGFAATYYVDGGTATDGGTGTSASPKKYIKSGIALMAGGDTLIIRDGVYAGTQNNMCGAGGNEWAGIASGSAGSYTTIRAEHDFGVVIDGGGSLTGFYPASLSYAAVQGIIFRNGGSNVYLYHCNHIKVIKCAGYDTSSGNTCNFNSAGGDYILFEDCFAWGTGRYKFLIGGESTRTILRRCVGRYDWHDAEGPHGVFSFYGSGSSDNVAQNCIAINCLAASGFNTQALYAPNGSTRMTFDSCIALDIAGAGNFFESSASNPVLRNCVIWKGTDVGSQMYTEPVNASVTGCTIGAVAGAGVSAVNCTVKNSIIYGTGGAALNWSANDYCALYNNGANYANTSGGAHNISVDSFSGGLRYLPRIEAGSALKAAGENGVQIGAEITKRLGAAGTLYGETGWNTVTGEALWPFPNEDVIRAQMRTYTAHSVNGARGFCADNTTLTGYVWGYLGNTMPAEIYGGTANKAPTAAAGATPASGPPPLTVNFTGLGSDTDGTIAGYRWDFGDGTTSTQQNPSHNFTTAKNYAVTLTVTDNGGATGSAVVNVTVSAAAVTYSIGGYVRDAAGAGIGGTVVALAGDASRSATTASDGSYQFTGLPKNGSFVLTPTKTAWRFTPVSISTVSLNGNLVNQNFAGTASYAIRGYVRNAGGTGISGVSVALSGNASQTVVTGSDGSYQFLSLPANGNYTVTPSPAGISFSPVSLSTGSLRADWTSANFTGATAAATYYMAGTVTYNGAGLGGVTLSLTGSLTGSTVTASNGYYRFVALPANGNFVITPSKAGFTFNPVSDTKIGIGSNQENRDFTAIPVYYIRGYVRDSRGAAVRGATMNISGAKTASTTTDSNGFYQFTQLAAGANYTVTPTLSGWKFNPASLNISSLTGSLDNQNFAGSRKFYIRGSVKTTSGAVSKAMVVLAGSNSASVETDDNGNYLFSDLPEGSSYTVTAVKSGYSFNPASRSGELLAPIDGWDFYGTNFAALPEGEIKVIGSASGRGTIDPNRGETAKIFFKGNDIGRFELRVFSLSGELVWEASMDNVQEGAFEWAPKGIASGIYIAHIRGPGINTRKRIALLK